MPLPRCWRRLRRLPFALPLAAAVLLCLGAMCGSANARPLLVTAAGPTRGSPADRSRLLEAELRAPRRPDGLPSFGRGLDLLFRGLKNGIPVGPASLHIQVLSSSFLFEQQIPGELGTRTRVTRLVEPALQLRIPMGGPFWAYAEGRLGVAALRGAGLKLMPGIGFGIGCSWD